jgi:cytochrome c
MRLFANLSQRLLTAMGVACLIAGPVHAQGAIDVAAGRQLATVHCSRCHGIDDERFLLVQGARPLRDLKLLYRAEDLAEALAEGLDTAHPALPAFTFSPEERAALLAYVGSLS